ncbi:CDP-glycerol glycerophosphotransferase family protein [Alishewanella longhuensis]
MPELKLAETVEIITKSEYFDESYYIQQYPEVKMSEHSAQEHYLIAGAAAGFNPSDKFDTQFYLTTYPDIAKSGINPLLHFIKYGKAEGRITKAHDTLETDTAARQEQAENQASNDMVYKALSESELFDSVFYVSKYPDVKRSGVDPLTHYIEHGAAEGRIASTRFDTAYYLNSYPHIKKLGINPLYHYLEFGMAAGYVTNASIVQSSEQAVSIPDDMALYLLQRFLLSGDRAQFADFIKLINEQNIPALLSKNDYFSVMAEFLIQNQQTAAFPAFFANYENAALQLFYSAKLAYLTNNMQRCIELLQVLFYKGYKLPEAHYLLAEAAVKSANQPLAWETLTAVAGYSRRAKTFSILQRLVKTAADFQRYLNILNEWIGDKKTLRLHPEIVLATTQAAMRAKHFALAKELWHNTFEYHQSRKVNDIIVTNSSVNFVQLWHLPSWPVAIKNFVDQNLFSSIEQRLAASAAGCVQMLQTLGFEVFLSGRTAWEAQNEQPFSAFHSLELGFLGELQQLEQLIHSSELFETELSLQEGWLRFSLSDGTNVRLHHYQTNAENELLHSFAGLSWRHTYFRVEDLKISKQFKLPPETYFTDYYQTGVTDIALWWSDADNMEVIEQERAVIASYEQYYWYSRYALDSHTDLMLREISKLDGKAIYQRLAVKGTQVPTLQQILKDAPQVVLYVTGLEKVAYQGNMWIPVLEKLPVRCAIVLREKQTAAELIPTELPVYFMSTMRDLELLEEAGVKTILYPANTQKNVQTLRFHKMQHFFINHGDSDKVVNQSKFLMAYDKLLVAGPLAEQRIHNAGLPTRPGQIEHVGRPQVELMLERVNQPCSKLKTLLYAPTWEGFVEEANYSSVCELGLTMLKQILQTGEYQVLFKPHPYTGYNKEGNCQYYLEQMQALASEYKQLTLVDINLGIHPLMNQSDLLITDISSVLNDYLYTLKPIILVNPKAYSAETLATEFPSSRAANVLNEGDNVTDLLAFIRQQDPLYTKRQQVCVDALGDFPEGSLKRFEKIIIESTQKNANN